MEISACSSSPSTILPGSPPTVTQAAQETGQTGQSSSTVLTVAQSLSQQAESLEQRVDQFLQNVRAM